MNDMSQVYLLDNCDDVDPNILVDLIDLNDYIEKGGNDEIADKVHKYLYYSNKYEVFLDTSTNV